MLMAMADIRIMQGSTMRASHLILLAALGSCGPTEPRIRPCPQSYEFGNDGCALVAGRVVGSQGQPLAGIDVGNAEPAGGYLNAVYVQTDERGRFGYRVTCVLGCPPDTLPIWIWASVRPQPPQQVATIYDSVAVRLHFARVGHVPPPPESLVITLPVP